MSFPLLAPAGRRGGSLHRRSIRQGRLIPCSKHQRRKHCRLGTSRCGRGSWFPAGGRRDDYEFRWAGIVSYLGQQRQRQWGDHGGLPGRQLLFARLRALGRAGTITSFDAPGAIQTFPGSINAEGVITGTSPGRQRLSRLRAGGRRDDHEFRRAGSAIYLSLQHQRQRGNYGNYQDINVVFHGFRAGGRRDDHGVSMRRER
mgnify:CR=1 FL=1